MTRDALLTTHTNLPSEWMVKFQFKPTNLANPDWTSIFHMTAGDNDITDIGDIGDRIPAVFFRPSNGTHFTTALNNQDNFAIDFPPPPIGEWIKIRVSQELLNQGLKYRIFINDIEKLVAENSVAFAFEKVYAPDPQIHGVLRSQDPSRTSESMSRRNESER